MSTIPDLNDLRWATDGGTKTEPPTAKKNTGFVTREEPSPTNFNWTLNKTFDRLKLLQGSENHKIVGSQLQKDNFTADLLWSEVLDAALEAGDKIGLLEGVHPMAATKTLSLNNLELWSQSAGATINMNGFILTLSGNAVRGELNIINAVAGSLVISGANVEGLNIRTNDPAGVDFIGSGTIKVNGKLISAELATLEISTQPDHVLLTASEQALYSNDDRFIRFDSVAANFKRRDDTPVTIDDGDWVVVKSTETLAANLEFAGDRLRIEAHKGFQIDLGNQGDNIPYAIFIKGNNCKAELLVQQTVRSLAAILGDDKVTPMSNSLTAMENRRVIKNQGENNYIAYNREVIFRGGAPTAHTDFVKPNHPYLLEWDSYIYDGIKRDLPLLPNLDNTFKCWFTDMYYWLDRRFNEKLDVPDATLAYHTVTVPSRAARFMRQVGLDDPDRHSRTKQESYDDTIASADYTQVSDKIILQNNAARDIKNVKSGQRVQATGLPGGSTGTTIVRPGSIVTTPGSESFQIMNAEDFTPVTASASGDLTLNFSGMAAGSAQTDAFQNITGSFEIRRAEGAGAPPVAFLGENAISITVGGGTITAASRVEVIPPDATLDLIEFDASDSPGTRTATENRALNFFGIPYYRL